MKNLYEVRVCVRNNDSGKEFYRTYFVRAYTGAAAQYHIAEMLEKNDFVTVENIEVTEATIIDVE